MKKRVYHVRFETVGNATMSMDVWSKNELGVIAKTKRMFPDAYNISMSEKHPYRPVSKPSTSH